MDWSRPAPRRHDAAGSTSRRSVHPGRAKSTGLERRPGHAPQRGVGGNGARRRCRWLEWRRVWRWRWRRRRTRRLPMSAESRRALGFGLLAAALGITVLMLLWLVTSGAEAGGVVLGLLLL